MKKSKCDIAKATTIITVSAMIIFGMVCFCVGLAEVVQFFVRLK